MFDEKDFDNFQSRLTQERWAHLVEEGKEFECIQEQLLVLGKEVAGHCRVQTRSQILNDKILSYLMNRITRIEKHLGLNPLLPDAELIDLCERKE